MTQLLKTVQKNNVIPQLEKISLCLSIVVTLLCIFLYGEYIGFLKGETSATLSYAPSVFAGNFDMFIKVQDDYEVLSKSYFFVFVVLLFVLFTHLVGKGILFKCVNLFLLCIPVFEYWQIFKLKQFAIRYHDFSRFDLFRQTIFLDLVGAIAVVSLIIVQIILIFLILRKKKAIS